MHTEDRRKAQNWSQSDVSASPREFKSFSANCDAYSGRRVIFSAIKDVSHVVQRGGGCD